jgi:hypothetical protein
LNGLLLLALNLNSGRVDNKAINFSRLLPVNQLIDSPIEVKKHKACLAALVLFPNSDKQKQFHSKALVKEYLVDCGVSLATLVKMLGVRNGR